MITAAAQVKVLDFGLAKFVRIAGMDPEAETRLWTYMSPEQSIGTEALALCRTHGDVWSIGTLLTDLAGLRVLEGRHDEARACAREALSCHQIIAAGRAQRAAWLYGAGEALLESIGGTGHMEMDPGAFASA